MEQIIQQLIEARNKAGLTLEDLHQRTRIPTRQLALLEACEFDKIGPPVYVRGFARRYAREVGLDPDLLFGEETRDKLPHRQAKAPRFNKPKPSLAPLLRILVVVTLIAVTAFLVHTAVVNFFSDAPLPPPNVPPVEEPDPNGQDPDGVEDEEPAPEVTVELMEQSGRDYVYLVRHAAEIQVTAAFSGRVWYRATVDGEVLRSNHADDGDELQWTAQSELELNLGNAPDTVLNINGLEIIGREVDLPGNSMNLRVILEQQDSENGDEDGQ